MSDFLDTLKKDRQKFQEQNKRFWKWFFGIVLFLIAYVFFTAIGWLGEMPSFEELENPKSLLASEIYSDNNKVLGKYYLENRSSSTYEQISPDVINALISTEDERFEEHSGIDGRGLLRAVLFLGTNGGASTITQQLAKNLFPSLRGQNIFKKIHGKIKENITAIKLEKNYSKREIITMYLNTVDYGSLAFGLKSASNTYFGVDPIDLNIQQSAALVGLLKAPTYYSPSRNPENSKRRRMVVFNQMRKNGHLTTEQYDSLRVLDLDMSNYKMQTHNEGEATYFREYLRDYLKEWCKTHYRIDKDGNKVPYNLYKDGLKIYTTINFKMQQYAEEAVKVHLTTLQKEFFEHWKDRKTAPFSTDLSEEEVENIMNTAMKRSDRYRNAKDAGLSKSDIAQQFLKPVKMKVFSWQGTRDTILSPMDSIRYYKHFLQVGFMSMNPATGDIKAWVGGINAKHFQYDHVKSSKRQVGSTFKPFVYALAMQEGFSPCSEFPNTPISFKTNDGPWTPHNSDKSHAGEMMTLKSALANSVNIITARVMNQFGPQAVVDLVKRLGVTTEMKPYPSICLGTADISVYEMVGAHSTFANKGVWVEPIFLTRIEDKNGNLLEDFIPKTREVLSEETAYLTIQLMKGVVESGTGVRLRYRYGLSQPIAGKTGTTQNNSDGWFIGSTPDLVSGVWVGCEDRGAHFRSTNLGQGASMALPIWAEYMKRVWGDRSLNVSQGDFMRPQTLEVETDCAVYKAQNGGGTITVDGDPKTQNVIPE